MRQQTQEGLSIHDRTLACHVDGQNSVSVSKHRKYGSRRITVIEQHVAKLYDH